MSPQHVALLLVEDNPGDARLIQETLSQSKLTRFAVTRAARLDEALAALKASPHDAVLLDLTLPDSRGIDTFLRLRAAFPAVPVVILTGLDGEDTGVRAVQEGAQDYLVKGEPAAEAVSRVIRHAIERQLSAGHLARERARLVEAQSVAKVGSWETDLDTMNVLWSDETHRIFETDAAAFQPTHAAFLALVHPEDRERVDAAFLASRGVPGRHAIEHRIVLRDGRLKVLEERWHIRDGGTVAVGTCQDVTDRVVARRLVEDSNSRFKRMAESISQVFWMTDVEQKTMVYVSPAYESIWGRTCESLYRDPRNWIEAIVPEDRARVLAAHPRQIAGAYDVTYRIKRPDGEIRWIRDRAFPVKDEADVVQQLTGVAQDVTKEILAEAALLRSQEFLEKAQEVANIGSWINPLDEGEDMVWSKECRRILGVPPDKRLAASDFMELVHPDDRALVASSRAHAIGERGSFNCEHRIIRPDGVQRWVTTRAELVVDKADGRSKLLGIVKDITDKVEGARRLAETESMLRQAQKMEAMGRLAGGVAHDFNNILTAILGLSEMTIAALPKDSPLRDDVEEIRQSGLRAANLTQQLLAFSRRQVTSPRILSLDEVIAGLSKMLGRIIGEHVELRIEPGAADASLKADPGQLEQLLMNLVVNARDAMPKGGRITIRTEAASLDAAQARREGVPAGRYVVLSVADTGTGMTPEVKSHLFEPFYTTKEKGKGTGLGLATVYGVVKQSGGEIRCVSRENAGTTFRILLPCVEAAPDRDAPSPRRSAAKGGETVLIVEDEEPVRRLAARILRSLGYEVLAAADGAQGLALLRSPAGAKVELLMTDMVMPVMSGWDLAREAGAERPGLPVLFVSGYTDDTFEGMCILDDTTDILPKPFTAEDLAARVRAALDAA
ncbi:MAG: PAS domain-containing protein [Elusimicrobiota bacterium]|nr:MAG: PAS domain-containing protein [Elusimicrobiota bacterium]